MRRLTALALALLAGGCTTEVVGQIVIAVQTDIHLPKDIDTIRIEVFNEGVPKLKNDYERLGTPDGAFLLPGTLTLLSSDDPSDAVQVVVSAFSGGRLPTGDVRIVREVVTTIPEGRTATLQLPLQFLCDGKATIVDGNPVSDCPEGQTCLAGSCADKAVDSATLPDFRQEDIFTPGVCLDVGVCFNLGDVLEVAEDCSVATAPDTNIALQTEGDGICGAIGCFVALDAESPLGWQTRDDGRVQLPPAVCSLVDDKVIVNVVGAPANDLCPLKRVSVPTCGPWSAAGPSFPYDGPIVLSGGQGHPLSMTLGAQGDVVWTNGGTLAGDGSVKSVPAQGGTPTLIASDQAPPRDVVVNPSGLTVWTVADELTGGAVVSAEPGGDPAVLVGGLTLPEGIALSGDIVYWTDFGPLGTGGIYRGDVGSGGQNLITPNVNYPFRVAADDRHIYWTDEGTLGNTDGGVQRFAIGGAAEPIQLALATPRGLALDLGADGHAVALFFTTFDADGSVWRALIAANGDLGAVEEIAADQPFPSGVTIDATYVYWTDRGDGTVRRLPKDAPAFSTDALVLATEQRSPGEIAVDADFVYWVNEGTAAAAQLDGAVVRLDKPL